MFLEWLGLGVEGLVVLLWRGGILGVLAVNLWDSMRAK